jgi:hypothetical protein
LTRLTDRRRLELRRIAWPVCRGRRDDERRGKQADNRHDAGTHGRATARSEPARLSAPRRERIDCVVFMASSKAKKLLVPGILK